MVITGMNRFFAKHGRIAFFLIAVVISVSFVLYMSGLNVVDLIFSRSQRPSNVVLMGREITQNDRINAVDSLLIQQSLMYPMVSLERPDYAKLDPYAIKQLMLDYAAQDRGIAIGNKEVGEYIKTIPTFQTKGKFDLKKFNNYVEEKLKPRHFDKKDLDEAVRAQLAVEKLTKDVTDNILILPEEIKQSFYNFQEKAKVKTAQFKASDFEKSLKVTDAEVESYFKANLKKYQTPPAVKAEVVCFRYGSYKKEAYGKITEKEVEKYYNDNKYLYVKKAPKPVKDTKKKTKPKKAEYKPLTEVSGKIKNIIANNKAKELAAKAATNYSDAVYDLTKDLFYNIKDAKEAHGKCQEMFAKYAKQKTVKIFDTGWIYEGKTVIKGLGNEPELATTIAGIFIDNPVSETIKGKKAAFVALLIEKKGPQAESFDSVKTKVMTDLKTSTSINLAREAARNAALKIGEALDKGEKLDGISGKLKIKFNSVPQALVASQPLFMTDGGLIHAAAFETRQGEISAVVNTANGALLVYVENKSFPTDKEFDAQKAMFTNRYTMMKKRVTWDSFTSTLTAASVAPEKSK